MEFHSTKYQITVLQSIYFKTKAKNKSNNLGSSLPNSSAAIYNITKHSQEIQAIKKEVRSKLESILIQSSKIKRNKNKKEAVQYTLNNMSNLPWDVDIIQYKRKMKHGTVWHYDAYSTFGTAIIFLNDSKQGRLHVEGIDIPEGLRPGDILFLDPNTRHKVEKAARDEDRVVVTLVF